MSRFSEQDFIKSCSYKNKKQHTQMLANVTRHIVDYTGRLSIESSKIVYLF